MLAALPACVTLKQRARICATCTVENNTDRRDCTIVRTVTVPVNVPGVPGPTVFLPNPCAALCDENGKLREGAHIDAIKDGHTLNLTARGGSLEASLASPAKTIEATVNQTEHHSITSTTKTQLQPCPDQRTDFDGFCRWWFYITALILGAYLVFRYLRWKYWRPPKTG
jgi:hypothetical protein